MSIDERMKKIADATAFIKEKINGIKPEIGIVLGSGLGKLADSIENPIIIPYTTIPNFSKSTAIGHKGNFIVGTIEGKVVCAMQGRFHYYEGYSLEQVTLPIRVMALLGIKYLFVSNAAGGVNPYYRVGDLMIICDHINRIPNPLVGPNLDEFGPRFPDMTRPYNLDLIEKAEEVASHLGIPLRKGVYFGGTGPSYETPAEYKYFRIIGSDAIGMSTTPEVIVANHCSIPVFGMSVITNEAYEFTENMVNDADDVIKAADAASDKMLLIFKGLIASL